MRKSLTEARKKVPQAEGDVEQRTVMARMAPPQMATHFFGLFALSGTVTAFLTPLMVATTTGWFRSERVGFASLAVLMVIGAGLLFAVREERATVAPEQG